MSVNALEFEYQRCDEQINALRIRQRELAGLIDQARLRARPTYPTEAQALGLVEAARRIKAKEPADSHHGDPTPTYGVVVVGTRGFVSVRHDAPYQKRGGGALWDFTDADIAAFTEILAEQGLTILDTWRHGNGVSIIAKEA